MAERILLYGVTGSGKSTLASRVADYRRIVSLARLVRRSLMRAIDHHPICNGNTESFRQLFSMNSIVAWHFRSFSRKRGRMRAWASDPAGPAAVLLARPRDTRRWLDGLSRVEAVGTA